MGDPGSLEATGTPERPIPNPSPAAEATSDLEPRQTGRARGPSAGVGRRCHAPPRAPRADAVWPPIVRTARTSTGSCVRSLIGPGPTSSVDPPVRSRPIPRLVTQSRRCFGPRRSGHLSPTSSYGVLKNCSGSPMSRPSSSPQYRQPDFSSIARIAALERLVEVQTSCIPWLFNESKLNPRPHRLALGSTMSNEMNGLSKKY